MHIYFAFLWQIISRAINYMKKMQISTCVYSLLMVGYVSNIDGALEKRLTHMPFTHAFTGSNPVQVTICKLVQDIYLGFLFCLKNN